MLILMMTIAPVHLAMAVAIDPVAVLPTIRSMIPIAPSTTRQVEEGNQHAQAEQRHTARIFHCIAPV
jgi:hypothetical protein